ncbi:MAG: cupin domain-containing protein, partial [Bacteroidota bacterium]
GHYNWGDNCSGWHLVKTPTLSVIEELMPPHTQEQMHYHEFAQQFFRILKGKAIFEIGEEIVEVEAGSGIHIRPNTKHRIRNDQAVDLEFLVISEPTTRGDRYQLANE